MCTSLAPRRTASSSQTSIARPLARMRVAATAGWVMVHRRRARGACRRGGLGLALGDVLTLRREQLLQPRRREVAELDQDLAELRRPALALLHDRGFDELLLGDELEVERQAPEETVVLLFDHRRSA
jgi:uncharacterized membrane protein